MHCLEAVPGGHFCHAALPDCGNVRLERGEDLADLGQHLGLPDLRLGRLGWQGSGVRVRARVRVRVYTVGVRVRVRVGVKVRVKVWVRVKVRVS